MLIRVGKRSVYKLDLEQIKKNEINVQLNASCLLTWHGQEKSGIVQLFYRRVKGQGQKKPPLMYMCAHPCINCKCKYVSEESFHMSVYFKHKVL